jgi:site-specific DNA-methyltransferase (adenine-specific)
MPLIPKTKNKVKLYNADALSILDQLGDNSIDLIISDPPYESLEKHRSVGTTTRLKKKWFPIVKNEYFILFFVEARRVLKNNTHLYLQCDQETMFIIVPMAINAGLKFCKFLIWDKMAISTGYHWRNSFECVLFFEKGKRKLNNNSWSDLQRFKRLKGKDPYPTQKPVELIDRLIVNSSNIGETVFDPFMGSGTVGVSAIKNKRNFIGNDIEKDAFETAKERLNGTTHSC